ncbi:hypothetical protein ES703_09604 [subsurface metagenome]
MNEIEIAIRESSWAFMHIVLPKIRHWGWLKEGKIIPIETQTKHWLTKKFDVLAGMDFLQIKTGIGMRSIANRVQWGRNDKTITIRKTSGGSSNTELKKRLSAIFGKEGYLYPFLTIHSYINIKGDFGKLLFSSMIKTKELFEYYKYHPGLFFEKENREDGNLFECVHAYSLRNYGADIEIYDLEPDLKFLRKL